MTQDNTPNRPQRKESKVEVAKKNSRHLRGDIAETLASGAAHFSADDAQVLKHHGVYQQDDRDTRLERKKANLESDRFFMVRVALPGGALTAGQYLALDDIADQHANGTLRVTTRQGFQLHGVYLPHLKPAIATINHKLMTTLAACGDVERNVMATPAPLADEAHRAVQQLAVDIARELRPQTRAYHEIWLDGEKIASSETDSEPFYGDRYLPRKFKTGVTLADDNSIDIYSYDCGLIAIVENQRVVGFNIVCGGGMGMTHHKPDTFAALARPIAFIAPQHAIDAVRTIAAIFRDHGNRADRKHARLKYLIAEWGFDRFCQTFRDRADFPVDPPRPLPRPQYRDYLGRHPQNDGRWFYGVPIANGRIADRDDHHLKSALRAVVEAHRPGIRLTPNQNMLFTDLAEAQLDNIEVLLRAHGVTPAPELSLARRYAMSCPALPTCGLALTEAERAFPKVVSAFEAALEELGLDDEPLTLRMTGCPNGCARPYTADIGFVGRKPGERYSIYVGGGLAGDRMADLYAEDIHINDLVDTMTPLLRGFARQRRNGESFSDFYQRVVGRTESRRTITGQESETRASIPLEVLQ
jgi:sulfite reductase (ferredoxin)